ncbi:MAG TPA: BTAD domain-containing putative transcriptional regulator [Pyrinomonadaceae bacterium]|jgi:DNA-binding SARP family transcriptional activator/tetratricopeptide (TPR) repeat protein
MQRPSFFLRTKLLPPRAVIDLLSRPRLTQKLQTNLSAPVTLVTADAGYGKTTLVADFIRNQPQRPAVWYQLDHTDADPFTFLGYIVHGIRRVVADFGETILSYLEEAGDDLIRNPERAVDLLLNEILETIEQPLILVLDDYHHIGRETIVHRLVDRLLAYSSDVLHVVITTRDLPPLAVVRRRTQGGALVITRDDLLFTDEETRDLFRKSLNIELKPEELAEYRKRTHGWATALQLIRQVAEEQTHSANHTANMDLTDVLRQSEKDIFDYFAEEVFAREPEETQQLMLKLSLLESLPLDVCSQLFPEARTAAVLPTLVQRNVFVTVAGEGGGEVYRFHPLFRDFLLRRLRTEIGRDSVAKERTGIAEFFLARRQWEQATPYLLAAENYGRAAEIIAEAGENWLTSGAILSLGMFSDRIPEENLNQFPRALIYKAEVARLQGETEKAVNILRRAVKLLNEKNDAEGEAEALHSLASLARRGGDCRDSLAFLEQAERLVGEDSEVRMKCENTRGLCLIAQGSWSGAERHFRLALEAAERRGDARFVRLVSHNLGVPAGLRGDFGESLRWLRRMLGDEQTAQLPQEAVGHLNVARMYIYRGELTEAETHLNKALELCQLYNLKSLRAEVFESYGNFYREKRDFPHAAEYYERARKSYEEAGIDPLAKELDEERALLAVMRGDAAAARNLLERLLEFRQKAKNEIGIHTARLSLCRVRLMQRETENLAAELEEILQYFHAQNLYYYEASASVLIASVCHHAGLRKEMFQHAKRALDLAARFDYEYWLRSEIERYPTLFADEDVIEHLPVDLRPNIEEEKRRKGEEESAKSAQTVSSSLLSFSSSPTAPVVDLTLKVLGPVEIFRDSSKPFAPDAWTTRRARDIFCFIATSRHRRVEKDSLIDTFWGESDFEAVEKNFHPTISHIRKALNSRQTIKQNFLLYRDGAYQLNPELSYSIDTEDFDRFFAEAEAAKRDGDEARFRENLDAAHKLYRGEFMAGIYDDWAEEQRAFYREQYGRILNALAKIAFKEKDWSQTIKLASEILREDAYREDVHRLLMRVYAAQGKRSKVKEQFENLREMLNKELGVEPAPETRRAFQELFK